MGNFEGFGKGAGGRGDEGAVLRRKGRPHWKPGRW
jgi:hypothetical protein